MAPQLSPSFPLLNNNTVCIYESGIIVLVAPSLLLSVQAERISSSSVNVVVDVDQDADCVGPLTMNALIANSSSGNFSRQSEDFADTTFEYQSLSPETYTVVIEIRDDVSFVVARDEVSFTGEWS